MENNLTIPTPSIPPYHTTITAQEECWDYELTEEDKWTSPRTISITPNTRHLVLTLTYSDPAKSSFDPDLYASWGKAPTRENSDFSERSRNDISVLNIYPEDKPLENALIFSVHSYTGKGSVKVCANKYQCRNRNCDRGNFPDNTCDAETGKCACRTITTGQFCEISVIDFNFGNQVLPITSTNAKVLNYDAKEVTGTLHFDVSRPIDVTSNIRILLSRGVVPTELSYDYEATISGWTDDASIVVPIRDYAPGNWYLSLQSEAQNSNFSLDIRAAHYFCSNDCSKHGDCIKQQDSSYKCKCQNDYSAFDDCSLYARTLHANNTYALDLTPRGSHSFQFDITQAVEDVNVEVVLRYQHDTACSSVSCPDIFVTKSTSSKSRASQSRFMARSKAPKTREQAIVLPDAYLETGIYTVTVYNPAFSAQKGSIEIHYTPHCPNNCSGHGSCSWDGLCRCHEGYHSTDCSVNNAVCEAKLPAKSGVGGLGVFFAVILALGLGTIGGALLFKVLVKGHGKQTQQQNAGLSTDDQYAQLN